MNTKERLQKIIDLADGDVALIAEAFHKINSGSRAPALALMLVSQSNTHQVAHDYIDLATMVCGFLAQDHRYADKLGDLGSIHHSLDVMHKLIDKQITSTSGKLMIKAFCDVYKK